MAEDPALDDAALNDAALDDLAMRLGAISGVSGVMLGGSRARGEHTPQSDYDLGLYYRAPLDTGGLRALAREVCGSSVEVSEPGGWGPWVDGGAWLRIGDASVDWIYRELTRVRRAWHDAQQGTFGFHAQVGHPFGFPDFAYPAEVALGVVLYDPTGELTESKRAASTYPPALADALVDRLWEADFLVSGMRKSLSRADPVWCAGCLFRIVGLCVHALHARAGRWLINEKAALASAQRLPITPPGFLQRAQRICGRIGVTSRELAGTLDAAEQLIATTRGVVC